jgi:carboxymethylenebutenolidase
MRRHLVVLALIAVAVSSAASSTSRPSPRTTRSGLPSAEHAVNVLNTTTRHREWINVATDASPVLAFVVYPERADKAPAVMVNVTDEPGSVRARAIADQLAAEGFIAVVPDVSNGAGYEASRKYAEHLPAANGTSVRLNLDMRRGRADVVADARAVARFNATPENWPQVVEYLSRVTRNHPTFVRAAVPTSLDEHAMHAGHAMHLEHAAALAAQNQPSGSTASRTIPGLAEKPRNLPASYYTATETLARSTLKKEWVDIPVGTAKLHMWVEYPRGNEKTGVVIVMQHGLGLDDWTRSVADQLASDGFIAVAPDAWSGAGPNGGNRDSFKFDDEAIAAGQRTVSPDEHQRRYKAARDWALALPRANGKSASLGFCYGGNHSFLFAAGVPGLNAAVVFYGGAPAEDLLKNINAAVLGFYGENDARVTATVAPTTDAMKRLGKSYESHIYPKVTHSFLYFQDLSVNREAVADAWPRTSAFLNRHLR